ncbi:MAG TPA: hypothetical protein VHM19_01445 [Polyangiales bacterium]|nr:hypothetical protein [Polyangiales bacterium]
MDKLVSRIPPPPRVPRVDGVNPIAPTVPMGTAQPHPDDHPPLPSWREKQIARGREIGQTYGALIAAILLCALLAWAIR